MNKAFQRPKLTYKNLVTNKDVRKRERMFYASLDGCRFVEYDDDDDDEFDWDQGL
tara:strand:- start:280 stop:444 length:165 start_codon:yes stop_codon:yes gene_type:complete